MLFHRLQQTEIVRSEIPLELRGRFARRIERRLQIGREALQIARMLRQLSTVEVGSGESILGDEHRTEILVLESHPIHGSIHLFLLIALFFEVITAAVAVFVGQRRIHVLKVVALLVLAHVVFPLQFESLRLGRELLGESFRAHTHIEHIVVGEGVVNGNFLAVLTFRRHRHSPCRHVLRHEIKR